MKEELKSAHKESGAQYVTNSGTHLMLKWSAISCCSHTKELLHVMEHSLVRGPD